MKIRVDLDWVKFNFVPTNGTYDMIERGKLYNGKEVSRLERCDDQVDVTFVAGTLQTISNINHVQYMQGTKIIRFDE